MGSLDIKLLIFLIILIGFFSAIIASVIGLGGGLIGIPLIMLVIGEHNLEAKLISYVSIAALSLFAGFKYFKQKRKLLWRPAFLILIGLIPVTVITEIYVGPLLDSNNFKPYFHIIYALVIFGIMLLINFKDNFKFKKTPNWTLPFFGSVIGLLSGSIGLSGGVLFLPLLTIGLHVKLKDAAVTSLVLKFFTSTVNIMAGGFGGQYNEFGAHGVFWALPLIILIGSIAGSQIGPLLNKKMSNRKIKIFFNVIMTLLLIWEVVDSILVFNGVLS